MKALLYSVFFLLACLLMASCQDEQVVTNDDLLHTWEAKEFMSLESVTYPKNDGVAILLTFKNDGTYYVKLDVNTCSGRYETGSNKGLTMDYPPCTEKCCDSEFSNKLAAMLSKVTSYRITGDHLYLSVPEWGILNWRGEIEGLKAKIIGELDIFFNHLFLTKLWDKGDSGDIGLL